MKKTNTRVLLVLLMLFSTLGHVLAVTVDGIEYSLSESDLTATVVKPTSGVYTLDEMTVPGQITCDSKTYVVVTIATNAFSNCANLTKVTLPNTIKSIASNAFSASKKLVSVNIPEGVTKIGDYAFKACDDLRTMDLPNSVVSVGEGAFSNCVSLSGITLSDHLTSIMQETFMGCTKLSSLAIPSSVNSISPYAFSYCSSLATIDIPSSIKNVGVNAFSDTKWFNDQPTGVVYVGKVAYKYKGAMPANTSIVLRPCVECIAEEAFENCSNLKCITIPSATKSIENWAFHNCNGLECVTILAETPPTVYQQTYGVPKATPNLYTVNDAAYRSSSSFTTYFDSNHIKDLSFVVPVSSVGYATFSAPVATEIPEGVKVYYAKNDEPLTDGCGVITFEGLEGHIPAYCGVLLKAQEGSYTFSLAKQAVTPVTDNLFSDTGYDAVQSGASDYVLAKPKGYEVGMYIAKENIEIPIHKAFFRLNATNNVKGYVFNFSTPTGLDTVASDISSNTYFDINGKCQPNPQRGKPYIVNGKVAIKY